MAKIIDKIKEELIGKTLSFDELEEIMSDYRYFLVEKDDEGNEREDNIVKYTNYSGQLWIKFDKAENMCIIIRSISPVNRLENELTRVEPFRCYEDLEKVMNYFKDNGYYNHWITGWLMVSLGRRVGDTIALKWSDIFRKDGKYRERLTQLKEEKTGKKLAPRLNALARLRIDEYISMVDIKPMKHYDERIVHTSSAAFRKMTKKAIDCVGLTYQLSTHSYRKYYSNTIYRLHPQDADNLMIVQTLLGHSSPEITKIYIGEIDKKQDKYNEDYSNYMIAKDNGINMDISNSPIVSVKSDFYREILGKCFDMAIEGKDKFEAINELLKMTENQMI